MIISWVPTPVTWRRAKGNTIEVLPRSLQADTCVRQMAAVLEVDETACTEVSVEDVILARETGWRVAIVGHFPFAQRMRRAATEFREVELHPQPGDLPAEQPTEIPSHADMVTLIGLCHPDAFVTLLGARTGRELELAKGGRWPG